MKSIIVIALLAGCSAVHAASGVPENWVRPTAPFEVFDDVWWVGTEGLGAWLFVTDDGLVLLDVGMPENAEAVAANIGALGFAVTDVRILLNSHAHFDHSGGLARLKADSGARLLASAADRQALEEGIYPGWEELAYLEFPPVQVDRVIEDGETVTLGGVSLTAHLTPGHSPGCTSWAFDAHDGDETYRALIFCSASVALNRLAPEPQYPGIVDDYRRTFDTMRALPVDVWLAPHAEQFGLAEKRARQGGDTNPFVDPTEKDRRMAAFEAAFEAALAEQAQASP
ncbi:MAG TPA: subclass B3 metallo-beta-lactamase [Pseudomonadales bacterium]|nr:subclass B3 metallo-beta-lactamase [Pseudomonadales bacterium]